MANMAQERQQAHALLDRLPPGQLAAVLGLLETMLDPIDLRLGDYRVRFRNLGDSIEILRVRHRKEAYR